MGAGNRGPLINVEGIRENKNHHPSVCHSNNPLMDAEINGQMFEENQDICRVQSISLRYLLITKEK